MSTWRWTTKEDDAEFTKSKRDHDADSGKFQSQFHKFQHNYIISPIQALPPTGQLKWPENHPQFQADLIKAKLQYPATKYKEMESSLAAAQKEIAYWKRSVPQAFSLNQKILWLERRIHNAELETL